MFLELYRLRWQVELLFKRLKSLLQFDGIHQIAPLEMSSVATPFQWPGQKRELITWIETSDMQRMASVPAMSPQSLTPRGLLNSTIARMS
jgi:hypothetical protein